MKKLKFKKIKKIYLIIFEYNTQNRNKILHKDITH